MARNTGAKCRLCRREQTKLYLKGDRCDSPKCAYSKRETLPGAHSVARGRLSSYGVQFREKQKVKRTYGLTETQFRRFFSDASAAKGNTGVKLLQLLELRLDNVVYRLGFAPSRSFARQMVSHGHISVNGKKLDIPSYVLSVGDVVEISPRALNLKMVKEAKAMKGVIPSWIEKGKEPKGRISQEPARDMIDEGINEQLIVELYSR